MSLFGRNVRRHRVQKNMTQQELADIMGVTQKTISLYETNRYCPKYSVRELIAEKLKVPLSELMGKPKIVQY